MGSIKKIGVLILFVAIALASVVLQRKPLENTSIEIFPIFDVQRNASGPVTAADRHWQPFRSMYADNVPSPFTFDAVLPHHQKPGIYTLWIQTSQGANHGRLTIEANGARLLDVENRSPDYLSVLKYVGDVSVDEKPVRLRVTSINDQQPTHIVEVGLFILTPPGTPPELILTQIGRVGEVHSYNSLALWSLLVVAFLALSWYSRDVTFLDEGWSAAKICSALILAVSVLITFQAATSKQSVVAMKLSSTVVQRPAPQDFTMETRLKDWIGVEAGSLKNLGAVILPTAFHRDSVPDNLKNSTGTLDAAIYYAPRSNEHEGFLETALAGNLKSVQTMSQDRLYLILITLLNITCSVIVISCFVRRNRMLAAAGIGAAVLVSVFISLRIVEGAGDTFLDLRHAWNLIHHGLPSVNAARWLNGTDAFLPQVFIALFGLFGLDPVNVTIIFNLCGTALLIIVAHAFVLRLTADHAWALFAALSIGLYPDVLWSGTMGSSTTLAAAFALAAGYCVLFTDKQRLGMFFMAFLPLVRFEGAIFSVLLFTYAYILQPFLPSLFAGRIGAWFWRVLHNGARVALPGALLIALGYALYGNFLPLPISFRFSDMNSNLFSTGIDSLVSSLNYHALPLFIIGSILFGVLGFIGKRLAGLDPYPVSSVNLAVLVVLVFLFTLFNHIGGPDWAPSHWARQSIIFNLVVVLTFLIVFYRACFGSMRGWPRGVALLAFGLAFVVLHVRATEQFGATYLSNTIDRVYSGSPNHLAGVDYQVVTGKTLKDLLPEEAMIATVPNLATSYYAERDLMDITGLANPDVTFAPLNPFSWIAPLNRKRAMDAVGNTLPDVLILYDLGGYGMFYDGPDLRQAIGNFVRNETQQIKIDMAYYFAGSMDTLKSLGYRYVVVAMTNGANGLFVHDRIYDAFIRKLTENGFRAIGDEPVPYRVSPAVSVTFLPAPSPSE
ncbi:MAG: hypothetical protein LBR29_09200 [Methylobacteriaceae bacterium]|jgi:hypothetical protein|nr:hypothetical protein [Methylobacteriaceae bacterium]